MHLAENLNLTQMTNATQMHKHMHTQRQVRAPVRTQLARRCLSLTALLAGFLAASLMPFAAVAGGGHVASLSIRQCLRGAVQDAEFSVYGEDALTCTYRRGGRAVLSVLSVDIERYCARIGGSCGSAFAPPKLVDARGIELGRLPDNFPGEAAVSYVVRLERIVNGWPERIRLVGTSQGVSAAPRWTPLRWQRASGRYSESKLDEGAHR